MGVSLVRKVNTILGKHLREFRSGLERGDRYDRVIGYIVSPDFYRMDHGRRQRKLHAILERELSAADRQRIGPIVTMTPAEADIGQNAA